MMGKTTEFTLGQNVIINLNKEPGVVKGIWHSSEAETRYNVQYANKSGSVIWDWFAASDLSDGKPAS